MGNRVSPVCARSLPKVKCSMRRLILTLLVLSMAPALARAQGVHGSWADVQRLEPGSEIEIRVVTKDKDNFVRAKFVSASDDTLNFRQGKAQKTVDRQNIRQLGVLNKSKRKLYMIIGAAVGAVSLSLVPPYLPSSGEQSSAEINREKAVFAGIGAGIGLLGTFRSGYQTVYEVRK